MRVQLFNDKQVKTIFQSVERNSLKSFTKAHEELKALLDDEIKRQLESNTDVEKRKNDKQEELDIILKLVELNKQVTNISDNYFIDFKGYRRSKVVDFSEDSEKALLEWNESIDEDCNNIAMDAAKKVLGIDNLGYREDCLLHDIEARIATMAVSDYDSVVTQLEAQIKIEDYFVTL